MAEDGDREGLGDSAAAVIHRFQVRGLVYAAAPVGRGSDPD
ncbi:hypothetical protein CCACVL1_11549 [Corchorus capsularis]|uniref:Uncharacterized protein n=1 Tax=Corchorus capsularis TaxID=210143 RepID=A0A1R3IKS3_COCAP|nr:hypothetical protein CCACVL1_11549 [Corchorus capsularis]